MTRFQKEISGQLGSYWLRSAQEDAYDARDKFYEDAYVEDGVVRWKSNDRIPHDDMLEKMEYMGCEFDRIKSNDVRDQEVAAELAELRKQKHIHTEEELNEMRAAFGPGATVVNVLTGEKIKL